MNLTGKVVKILHLQASDYKTNVVIVPTKQYDNKTRILSVSLYDDKGIVSLSGYNRISLNGTSPNCTKLVATFDSSYFDYDANVAYVEIPGAFSQQVGKVVCDLTFNNGNGDNLSSQDFVLYVYPSQYSDDAIAGTNEYNALQKLLIEVENMSIWESYSSSKAYAKGNKVAYNGSSYICIDPCTGVVPTDEDHWLLIAAKGEKGNAGSGSGSGVDVVQTTGTSTTSVMSQDAVTKAIDAAKVTVTQETTGESTTEVMSQKATITAIKNEIKTALDAIPVYAGDVVKIISFTIAGTAYQAEEGMTWLQWVDSEYNTDGYSCEGSQYSVLIADQMIVRQTGGDVIVANTAYTLMTSGGGAMQ